MSKMQNETQCFSCGDFAEVMPCTTCGEPVCAKCREAHAEEHKAA